MSTFKQAARHAAAAWKRRTPTLADEARVKAPYCAHPEWGTHDFCLPVEHAACNLLPDGRNIALDRFEVDGIQWHDGTPAGPSNHLLDSQVQCLNALAPMIIDADAVRRSLGTVLDIAEVLPFDPDGARPGDLVAFEWIGRADYLDEGHGKARTRGKRTTSADAAIRYRASDGAIEIALIEWKYTESYTGTPLEGGDDALRSRRERYQRWWDSAGGPLRSDVMPYDDLFVEPFYQLMRLQLLAHEMERTQELAAERVRVVYAAPASNAALWASLSRPSHHAAGHHVGRIWESVVRRPGYFLLFNTADLIADGGPARAHFKDRYGHLAEV